VVQPKYKDVPNNATNTVVIKFFHVDWCPHCKRALPEWQSFCSKYDRKEINGHMVECEGGENGTDCTNTEDPVVNKIIQDNNIEHYPTVKMVKGGDTIEFEGKITNKNLEKFMNAIVNP